MSINKTVAEAMSFRPDMKPNGSSLVQAFVHETHEATVLIGARPQECQKQIPRGLRCMALRDHESANITPKLVDRKCFMPLRSVGDC